MRDLSNEEKNTGVMEGWNVGIMRNIQKPSNDKKCTVKRELKNEN